MNAKRTFALIAVILTVISSMMMIIPSDSDGEASKSTHLRVNPVWVTSNTGVITERDTGEVVLEVKAETVQYADGSLGLTVYMRNASMYTGYYIQQKQYNEPDDPNSTSFFYQASSMSYYTSSNWRQFAGMSTYSNARVFYADLYICDDVRSYASIPETDTLTLELRMTTTLMYDYTTEIAYDLNGGGGGPTAVTSNSISSETERGTVSMAISNATDMYRERYVFQGWATARDSTTFYQPGQYITVPAGETTTLYAIWKEDTVNVTLMDGDEVYSVLAVPRGDIPVLPSDLTKADNTFVGWFSDEGFNTPWDTSTAVTTNITLYAGWVPDLKFTTDPVADCRITKLSASKYLFDATVSKDYSTSAASVEWKVYKEGSLEYESTGPYMTYQFMDYGTYSVELKITNSNGVSSTYSEQMILEEPREGPSMTAIVAMTVMALLVAIVIGRMVM